MGIVLGVSGSLRNARFGAGSDKLVDEIKAIDTPEALVAYLEAQTRIRLEEFVQAGRDRGLPFDEIYRNLRKMRGDRGLSNSEAALTAALWGAHQAGESVKHCGLTRFFPATGEATDLDALRTLVLGADALLLSGPVYFGDRGSPMQEFIEFIRKDPQCAAHVRGKLYAGLAVGAKRNGGQETTLIYQMVDMANLSMLVVGNDGDNTAQYGGTNVAGDVGTLYKDDYGIDTSITTGRRLARAMQALERSERYQLDGIARIGVWVLQDLPDHHGLQLIKDLCKEMEAASEGVAFDVLDFSSTDIFRCIACDVCPTHLAQRDEYRCIITAEKDLFVRHHRDLLRADAVLLAAYSPVERGNANSVYQRFIERTRYLRRDDYALGDRLAAPMVISEVGSNQNLHIRMMTSLIRHQTVVHHPVVGFEHDNVLLKRERIVEDGVNFAHYARKLTIGRLSRSVQAASETWYNPVGYQISLAKRHEDCDAGIVEQVQEDRREQHQEQQLRLKVAVGGE